MSQEPTGLDAEGPARWFECTDIDREAVIRGKLLASAYRAQVERIEDLKTRNRALEEMREATESMLRGDDCGAEGKNLCGICRKCRKSDRQRLEAADRLKEGAKDVLAVRGKDFEINPLPAYMERPFSILQDLIEAYESATIRNI